MLLEDAYYNIGRLDRMSYGDTPVHRLDERAKIIATMLFILSVVSHSKYAVVQLLPYAAYPVAIAALGDVSFGFLSRYILLVSPFAVLIGIFNPILDRQVVMIAGLEMSAGWLSFISILLKFILTVSAVLLLIATSSFAGVARGLRRLGFPSLFVSQVLFLHRYLFVLFEETLRVVRAWGLRRSSSNTAGMRVTARIIGAMLVRTLERAERIYTAMLCRGFTGEMPTLVRHGFCSRDVLFLVVVITFLVLVRFVSVTDIAGRLVQETMG